MGTVEKHFFKLKKTTSVHGIAQHDVPQSSDNLQVGRRLDQAHHSRGSSTAVDRVRIAFPHFRET
jgi:hypothetical protein